MQSGSGLEHRSEGKIQAHPPDLLTNACYIIMEVRLSEASQFRCRLRR